MLLSKCFLAWIGEQLIGTRADYSRVLNTVLFNFWHSLRKHRKTADILWRLDWFLRVLWGNTLKLLVKFPWFESDLLQINYDIVQLENWETLQTSDHRRRSVSSLLFEVLPNQLWFQFFIAQKFSLHCRRFEARSLFHEKKKKKKEKPLGPG